MPRERKNMPNGREMGKEIPPEAKAEAEKMEKVRQMKEELINVAEVHEKAGHKSLRNFFKKAQPEEMKAASRAKETEIKLEEVARIAIKVVEGEPTSASELIEVQETKNILFEVGGVKSEKEWKEKYGKPFTETLENSAEARDLLKLEK